MENKSHAVVAGIFTLALLAAAVLIGMWLNRDRVQWVPYQIATKQSIPGLNPQANVRYRGLDVGKVEDISFDPQVPGQILVRINVRPDTPVTHSTFASLGYQGVTGIAYVQLDDDGSNPARLQSSKEHMARIDMRPSLFDQLQTRGLAILQQAHEVTRRLNDMLAPANQQAILNAFDKAGKAASAMEAIPRQLQPTLEKLPALTAQAQQTLRSVDTLAQNTSTLTVSLDKMSRNLQASDGALAQLGNAAEQMGSMASKLEYETLPLASDMRSSLRALNRTLDNLNERPQSVLFGMPRVAPGPGEPGFGALSR
ncbi:MlaD family protein [Noviherbaspirillum autotrophicum]|uniref:Signal peptide protein n=1 Tax=Noviherbaspirillum autotrophicum TaxID=709839 RepID=A0A0C2BP02_9BURK|nr:MlaD family protein [Noviherbaspirillum autotrophicum]KIF82995.1 signal peptide protein [Noviherbaspirillum autotrophicum]